MPGPRLKTPVAERLQDDLLLREPFFRQYGINRPQDKRALFDRERQPQPDAVAVKRRRTDGADLIKQSALGKQQQRAGGERHMGDRQQPRQAGCETSPAFTGPEKADEEKSNEQRPQRGDER